MFLQKIKIYFFLLAGSLVFISFNSCSDNQFPDYAKTSNGLYYRLEDIGDNDGKGKVGDYITAQITIKSEKDSVLYDTKRIGLDGAITFILEAPQHEKDYREGFQYLSSGDSATFITDAYSFYMQKNKIPLPKGINLQSIIKVFVRVLSIKTPEQHKKYMAGEKQKLEQGEYEEKKKIDQYLKDNSIVADTIGNGMYYIQIEKGNGPTPALGTVALINYHGCFLNGRSFDFLYESQPFEYLVGTEDQLIKGLEIGICRMQEGEKGKFIIPSHLAYGSNGSSSGIVPPFTTVIYDVELLKVQ